MSNNQIKNGTGLSVHSYDKEKKIVEIDFSGYEPENCNFLGEKDNCLRNDASVIFFAANCYWESFNLISNELDSRFEDNNSSADVENLILPYYFNFRHFVELELKALIVALSKQTPKTTHDISYLMKTLIELVSEIKYDPTDSYVFRGEIDYIITKKAVIQMCFDLEKLVDKYLKYEYAAEYYRYIFEQEKGDIVLKHPVIKLDYPTMNKLLYKIHKLFSEICMELQNIKYIYCIF